MSIQHQIAARFIASQRKSVEAVPAHVTETGTTSSKIPLPALSSPVESQQSSVSQGSQLPSPSSTAEPEETVVYTGEACSHVSQSGISFHFPASESKCRVELRYKVVNDDYVLPKGYEDMPLASSMFKITASDELPVPVTVRMEHCAIIEEDDSLMHMIAHGPPPYHFQPLLSGTFPLGERYGEIQVKRFSIFTILAKTLGLRLSLSVQVFYHVNTSSATFVVTKNLQRLISAVEKKYAPAKKGLEQSVLCGYETKEITLTIPDPPQEGGWCVVAACGPPKIQTRLIREYREGKTPPCIHLSMKWTGEGMPVEEKVKIAVVGTSVESFLLSCRPACASDSSPAALSLSQQSQSSSFSPFSPQLSLTSSDTPHQSQAPTSLHTPPTQHTGTPHQFQTPTSPPNQPTDTPHLSPSPHTPPAQHTDTPHMQRALPTDTPPAQRTDLLHPPPPVQHTDTPHPPKSNPKYKALLSHSDTLADTLDTNERAKTRLLRKLRANEWIDPKDDLTTDALVALALQKLETEGECVFDQFVGFMSDIAGLTDLATKMRGIVHTTPAQHTDTSHPPPPAQHTDTVHMQPAQYADTPHPPPAQHAADHLGLSAESRALRRSNTIFTRGVDPDNLVTVLYSNFLLTPEEYEKASQAIAPGDQRLKAMFMALECRVSANPSVFHTLIQVLQWEEALKDVADVIQGESNLLCEMSLT